MIRSVRAKYSEGVLEPLEPLALKEGAEVVVTLDDKPSSEAPGEAFRRSAGSWKGHSDPDELIGLIYDSRITGSREPPACASRTLIS